VGSLIARWFDELAKLRASLVRSQEINRELSAGLKMAEKELDRFRKANAFTPDGALRMRFSFEYNGQTYNNVHVISAHEIRAFGFRLTDGILERCAQGTAMELVRFFRKETGHS
jgi:hypothetical protein